MTCQECLYELATGSLRDLTPESEVMRHCATCPDCGPLATRLRDREYNAATILNTLPPISNPISVAETAGMIAHRRRVGKVVVFLTGAALAATIFTSLFVTDFGRKMIGADKSSLQTTTISLRCLSPAQAGDIIDPYFRTRGSIYFVTKSGVPAIAVRGTPSQIRKARELIREFDAADRATCALPGSNRTDEINPEVRRLREPNRAPSVGFPTPTK
jgi:hypothetical protein